MIWIARVGRLWLQRSNVRQQLLLEALLVRFALLDRTGVAETVTGSRFLPVGVANAPA